MWKKTFLPRARSHIFVHLVVLKILMFVPPRKNGFPNNLLLIRTLLTPRIVRNILTGRFKLDCNDRIHLNNPKFRFQITPPLTCPPALVMLHFALFYVMLGQGSQLIVPLLLEEPTWSYVNLVKPSKFKIWATIKPTKTDIFWALGKTPFLDCMVPPASRSRYMLCLQSRYFFKPGVMRISLGFLLWQLGYWENWEKIDVL